MKLHFDADTFEKIRLEFLPAALEIQHTPPRPLARGCGLAITLFSALILLWACIGKVDVVAIAEGKIIPSTRIKLVQPLEKGLIKQILVHEGQRVNAGDPLVILDRTSIAAGREHITSELRKTGENLARLYQLLSLLDNRPSDHVTEKIPDLQESLLQQQWQQYRAQLAALQSQLDHHTAERAANRELVRKLESTLPIASKRAENMKTLAGRKLIAEDQYLLQEETRITQQQDLAAARAHDEQITAAIAGSEQQIAALVAQNRVQVLAQINDTERQAESLRTQLAQANDLDSKQVLYAPAAGLVKDLAINTVGGVVLEAQQLMMIVPDTEQLEIEAWLQNRDIGYVHENDRAVVKIHTFPFTRYGTIDAIVTRVSGDAIADEKAVREKGGLLFGMSLKMSRNTLQVDGREVRLVPGMQVTAEIITGQRRIIDYFLSPLQKQVQESARER